MNYTHAALQALRYAGVDEYWALIDGERAELTALIGDWNRITSEQNARLETITLDTQAEEALRAVRVRIRAHRATLEDVFSGLGVCARREFSRLLDEHMDVDTPFDDWLGRLTPSDRDRATALVATI